MLDLIHGHKNDILCIISIKVQLKGLISHI